jgi:hypothetical protein
MVNKHCCYADCVTDSRKDKTAVFIGFVKPKIDTKRCLRWIHLCGRKKSDFNLWKVTKVRRFDLDGSVEKSNYQYFKEN